MNHFSKGMGAMDTADNKTRQAKNYPARMLDQIDTNKHNEQMDYLSSSMEIVDPGATEAVMLQLGEISCK